MDSSFFKNMEQKTGVSMTDVLNLASSLQSANFQDEDTVRGVIRQVGQMANREVTPEMEDKLVNSIVNKGQKLDIGALTEMMGNTLGKK